MSINLPWADDQSVVIFRYPWLSHDQCNTASELLRHRVSFSVALQFLSWWNCEFLAGWEASTLIDFFLRCIHHIIVIRRNQFMLFLLKKSICSIVIKKASLLIHWAFVFSADLMTFCSVIEFKKIVEHLFQNFNTVLKGWKCIFLW